MSQIIAIQADCKSGRQKFWEKKFSFANCKKKPFSSGMVTNSSIERRSKFFLISVFTCKCRSSILLTSDAHVAAIILKNHKTLKDLVSVSPTPTMPIQMPTTKLLSYYKPTRFCGNNCNFHLKRKPFEFTVETFCKHSSK